MYNVYMYVQNIHVHVQFICTCTTKALYNKCTSMYDHHYRCTAWEPTKRPSIISILRDLTPLVSPPSLPSQDDTRNNDGFDYTDSLGHVTIDFDLEDEEDEELLKFLQVHVTCKYLIVWLVKTRLAN